VSISPLARTSSSLGWLTRWWNSNKNIGRGTRVRDDYDKYYFNILDYTGSATRLFADPDFDGEPALITEQEMTETGETITEIVSEQTKSPNKRRGEGR
jgi:type I restriction enzyme R subunit